MSRQQEEEEGEGEQVRVSLRSGVDVDADNTSNNNGDDEGGGGSGKAPRLPRWTRQEILVLIQGKKVAENRVRRGRSAVLAASGGASVEPKWATVSSYCKRHGVNRGPVQCRKRWSNLAGDFKKIKEWESRLQEEDSADSFWLMRNDLRRDRRLPGFFDKEVYDILDGAASAPSLPDPDPDDPDPTLEVQTTEAAVFDSGRAAAPDDGLFSDLEHNEELGVTVTPEPDSNTTTSTVPTAIPILPIHHPAPTPISEKQYQPMPAPESTAPGSNEKQAASNPEFASTSQGGGGGRMKRRRLVMEDEGGEGDNSLQDQLIQVLEKNGRILSNQLEAQNISMQLDREERKDHTTSLVSVLNKLADALGRIADKL